MSDSGDNASGKIKKFEIALSLDNVQSCKFYCVVCKKEGAGCKRCERCRTVYYCSQACQRKDWNSGHKKVCKPDEKKRRWKKEIERIIKAHYVDIATQVRLIEKSGNIALVLVPTPGFAELVDGEPYNVCPVEKESVAAKSETWEERFAMFGGLRGLAHRYADGKTLTSITDDVDFLMHVVLPAVPTHAKKIPPNVFFV